MDEPRPTPRPPEPPWYERRPAPLQANELDDYDRQMAPERVKQRGSLFDRR